AELHFQLAQCLEALGRWDDARAEYVRARDLDRYPLRATTAINEIIREACRETRGTLADLEAAFRRHSEHGLPGYDLFRDHCHLTLKAHRLVAFEVTRAMYEAGLLPPSPVGDGPDVCEPLDYDATLGLRTHDHAAACEEVGIQILREVSSRSPNTARRQRARLELQQAVALDPNRPNALLHLGLILAAEEQRDEATRLLRRALTLDPHIADGHAYALRVLREMGVVPDTRQAK
ncbi:MAG: tetratricopeptide repeat protein, partial [Planctomycetes bacterium]|nr:tetratricopeptide repeat protein [Planctomycetota bacterium]